jgi:uncharacterized membrane protein YqjE
MPDQQGQSLQGLVAEAVRESTSLAQKEFALFRTEVSENLKAMLMGMAMLVMAAIFAIAAIMLFTEALVKWLATVVGSEALAALIVGGVLVIIAVALGLWGRSAISAASLAPTRTLHSLQRDSQVLSERVSG